MTGSRCFLLTLCCICGLNGDVNAASVTPAAAAPQTSAVAVGTTAEVPGSQGGLMTPNVKNPFAFDAIEFDAGRAHFGTAPLCPLRKVTAAGINGCTSGCTVYNFGREFCVVCCICCLAGGQYQCACSSACADE
jgi:hypothetical protein